MLVLPSEETPRILGRPLKCVLDFVVEGAGLLFTAIHRLGRWLALEHLSRGRSDLSLLYLGWASVILIRPSVALASFFLLQLK